MHTKFFLIVFLLLLGMAPLGCDRTDNPALWPREKIEQKLLNSYKNEIAELSLTPDGEGKYKGVAKSKEGETLQITVQQDSQSQRLNYSFKGDRGWHEDGNYNVH